MNIIAFLKKINYARSALCFIFFLCAGIFFPPTKVQASPPKEEIIKLPETELVYVLPFEATELENVVAVDIVKVFPRHDFVMGKLVRIWRAPRYSIVDGKRNSKVASWGLTIKEVLADGGVEVGEQDQVTPTLEQTVSGVEGIKIVRVAETKQSEIETIEYTTVNKDDPTLERGKTHIQQEGKRGKREKVYLVRREDGVEVSRSLISNEIIEPAKNKIILHGTKIVILSSETGEASWTPTKTASRRYKRGTLLRVTNLSNGRQVEVRVGDYGPAAYTGRILDLNKDAWLQISSGGLGVGVMQIKVEEIKE
ncbi:MAG TPA: G5 domain-containing protein [bacterium]|jgi:hypothetical protein|nr:G5 domain-containing protein [bacterium]